MKREGVNMKNERDIKQKGENDQKSVRKKKEEERG